MTDDDQSESIWCTPSGSSNDPIHDQGVQTTVDDHESDELLTQSCDQATAALEHKLLDELLAQSRDQTTATLEHKLLDELLAQSQDQTTGALGNDTRTEPSADSANKTYCWSYVKWCKQGSVGVFRCKRGDDCRHSHETPDEFSKNLNKSRTRRKLRKLFNITDTEIMQALQEEYSVKGKIKDIWVQLGKHQIILALIKHYPDKAALIPENVYPALVPRSVRTALISKKAYNQYGSKKN